jgi:antitoxin ParD1/3/4
LTGAHFSPLPRGKGAGRGLSHNPNRRAFCRPNMHLLAKIANAAIITSMPTRNINLTDHFDDFVAKQVSSGRYQNASEIVREALRLLEAQEEERKAKLKALRQAAKQGFDELDQGRGLVIKSKKALHQLMKELQAKASRSPAAKS